MNMFRTLHCKTFISGTFQFGEVFCYWAGAKKKQVLVLRTEAETGPTSHG